MKFRYQPSYQIPYLWQNLLWCLCKLYNHLSPELQEMIFVTCKEAGEDCAGEIFKAVTTMVAVRTVAYDGYMDESTLRRHIKKFYKLLYIKAKAKLGF